MAPRGRKIDSFSICREIFFCRGIKSNTGRPTLVGIYHLAPKEQRGAALIIALIVMTMLSMLTISSLEMLTISVQISGNHVHDLQALYIADAGVEHAISMLRTNPTVPSGIYGPVEFPVSSGNTYTMTIANSYLSDGTANITSTGTVSNFQRALVVMVEITGSSSPYSVGTTYWKEI